MTDDFKYYIEETNDILGIDPETISDEQIKYIDLNKKEIENSCENYINNSLDEFSSFYNDKSYALMSCLIMYGYRLGAARLKNQNSVITRQHGMKEEILWNTNLDAILNKERNSDESVISGNVMEWCINPLSNTEISSTIFKKMFINGISPIMSRSGIAKNRKLNLIIPPISKDILFPDWEELLIKNRINDIEVNICDYSVFLDKNIDNYQYIVINKMDEKHEYVIVSVYEKKRGQFVNQGCICFDNINDDYYELQNVSKQNIVLDKLDYMPKESKTKKIKLNIEYIKPTHPLEEGMISFLSLHSSNFYNDIFTLSTENKDTFSDAFSINKDVKISEVLYYFMNEKNLNKISLNDMVYYYNHLENNTNYIRNLLKTKKKTKLGSCTDFDKYIDISNVSRFPVNFGNIEWKLKDKNIDTINPFELTKDDALDAIIESIIKSEVVINTNYIAEEVLFLVNDDTDISPSALFSAKIYSKLLNMDNVVIAKCDEMISDDFMYIPDDTKVKNFVDKKVIIDRKREQQRQQLLRCVPNQSDLNVGLFTLNIRSKTVNALKKQKLITIKDLILEARGDLRNVRGLSKQGRAEVFRELRKKRISIRNGS